MKENDEIQSRREFFKNAAKKALPILGAIVLAGTPNIIHAARKPMGCEIGCENSCTGGCTGSCTYGCQTTCKGTCESTCKGCCSNACAHVYNQ
ncbi:MAG: Cys-Xaa-Xaa-Xaa repeat radical SAM target protein [Bacteroidales bacterium]|nr:Cys-Xaa-Xaa-Xaa repeat radical SAM target protein [Bacteroidales bacterium]